MPLSNWSLPRPYGELNRFEIQYAIDDALGEAHASLGGTRALQRDWLGAETEYKRCLELSPSYAIGHQWYAHMLLNLGRVEEALQEYRRALELDPLSSAINADAGRAYLVASDYGAAIERFRIVRERDPDFWNGQVHTLLAWAYLLNGMESEALDAFLQQELLPETKSMLRSTYREKGMAAVLKKGLELEIEKPSESRYRVMRGPCTDDPYNTAQLAAFLGERELAFECLQELVDLGGSLGINRNPFFAALRSDPRFTAFAKQMGLEE